MIKVSVISSSATILGIKEYSTLDNFIASIVKPNRSRTDHDEMWSPAIYKGGHKNDENFLGMPSLLVVDIDSSLNIEQCDARCKQFNLKYAILPSRNHRLEKKGVICDRYRVILFLSYPINTAGEFDATWKMIREEYFPELDASCSDEGRGYYYSTSVYSKSDEGYEIQPQKAVKESIKKLNRVNKPSSVKRNLSSWTKEFILNGTGIEEGRDNCILKAVSNLKISGYSEEEALDRMLIVPMDYDSEWNEQTIAKKVASLYRRSNVKYPELSIDSTQAKEFIMDSVLIIDGIEERNPLIVNLNTGLRWTLAIRKIIKILGKHDYEDYLSKNEIVATYTYNPFRYELLFKDENTGMFLFNDYQPAFWQKPSFFGGELPAKRDAPPEIIKDFLLHIVDSDKDSYEYLLDWIANALRGRNLTVLTAIGDEGIGKGTLGTLIGDLFGSSNWTKVRADVFKNQFNSQLEQKRFVFIDEMSLKSTDEYNRFKDIVNDVIELEKKGKDAIQIQNYASYFMASNDNTAISPSPGDRRFSLLNLSSKKLKDSNLRDKLHLLRDESVLEEFVGYLLHREIKHDMFTPFKAPRKAAEIDEASLMEWQRHLLQEFAEQHAGTDMPLKHVGLQIKAECSMRSPPGRRKLEKLADRYPNIIRLHKKGNERMIEFVAKESAQ